MLAAFGIGIPTKFLRLATGMFILFLLLSLFSPLPARAQSTQRSSAPPPPTLDVSQPMNTLFRDNYWTNIQVTIANTSLPLSGQLVAQMCNFVGRDSTQVGIVSPWSYKLPIHLAAGAQKQFSLSLPHGMGNFDAQSVLITLLDANGKVLTRTTVGRGYEVAPSDLLIGALSDQAENLSLALVRVALPNQKDTPTTVQLDATTFPTESALLSIYNVLILDDFSTSTLSQAQLMALRTWVNQGGTLLEMGGSDWQRTLGKLPADLLPVSLSGVQTLGAGTQLYPFSSPSSVYSYYAPSNQAPGALTVSSGVLRVSNIFSSNKTLQSSGSLPLIAKAQLGQGWLCYLAFDPMQAPLLTWSNQPDLWQMLFFSTLGDQFLIPNTATAHTTGPGDFLTHTGIIRLLSPELLPGPWILLLILLGYVLVLGPIRLLLLRRLQSAYLWRWRIFAVTVLVFSLLGYSFAFYQSSQETSDTTVSLIQFNQDSSFAHITTYHGLFIPSKDPFTLHLSGDNLAQLPSNNLLTYTHLSHANSEANFSLTYNESGASIDMANSTPWTLHPLVTERDSSFQGQIKTRFNLTSGRLVGTITNTLNTTLSDLYVLIPHGFARIGALAAGETRNIDLPLSVTPSGTQSLLAGQIAQQGGLATPYFPYTSSETPHNDFERHMALLSALSGTGTTFKQCDPACNRHAITTRDTLYFTDVHVPNPGQIDLPDPLLLSGTSATLIGWMDQSELPGNAMTINTKSQLPGRHENFLQMPLSIGITTLDHMPKNFIQGHVVDIEGFDAQLILPGIYTFSDGGLTFELPIPQMLKQQPGGLTLSIPDLLASPRGLDRFSNLTNLQALLYNWQTDHWDTIQLQQSSFSSRNTAAYLGHDQRVLVHISNSTDNMGRLIFGTPSLSLQH